MRGATKAKTGAAATVSEVTTNATVSSEEKDTEIRSWSHWQAHANSLKQAATLRATRPASELASNAARLILLDTIGCMLAAISLGHSGEFMS